MMILNTIAHVQMPRFELDKASSAGAIACSNNQPKDANPYPPDSILWYEWRSGWLQYDADYHPAGASVSLMEDLQYSSKFQILTITFA